MKTSIIIAMWEENQSICKLPGSVAVCLWEESIDCSGSEISRSALIVLTYTVKIYHKPVSGIFSYLCLGSGVFMCSGRQVINDCILCFLLPDSTFIYVCEGC